MLVLDSSRSDTVLARRAAVRFLRARCPWADVNDVLLVVSELLGNAVRHTEGGWLLRMTCRRESLVVEVYDSSSSRPVPRCGDSENGGGFGWGIVEQLTSSVTVRSHTVGKSVRAVWHPGHLQAPGEAPVEAHAQSHAQAA
ncbi:ATP-binding protein [Streptomyces virginiae]